MLLGVCICTYRARKHQTSEAKTAVCVSACNMAANRDRSLKKETERTARLCDISFSDEKH